MLKSAIAFFPVIALISLASIDAKAESIAKRIELSGKFESQLAFGTTTHIAQKKAFLLTPEIGIDLTPALHLTVIGRLRSDIADELEPGKPEQRNRSHYSTRHFTGTHADTELREAYIDAEIDNTFLRIGKQQVVWGQADGLKVLDILNPQTFREFILDDFEDSRIPLWTVNAEIAIGDAFMQVVWIADQTYDDIPKPGATFAFTSPQIIPSLAPGIPTTISTPTRPSKFLADSDIAAQFSLFINGWDLSLNYAYHYSDQPVIRRNHSQTGITVRQNYERTHLLGGSFSNVFGDFTFRGEIGYSSHRFFLTNNIADRDGVIESGELAYVVGTDYQGLRDWLVSAQFFQSIITNPDTNVVRDEVNTTTTFLVRRDLMNETLEAEVLLIHNLNQSDGVVQASLKYEWITNIHLSVGADIFYGVSKGLFGQFNDKDRVTVGVEVGF